MAAAGFVVETSGTLSAGAIWTPLADPVVTNGNNCVLTRNLGAAPAFYRLRK